jgi:AcrR family transcriptional regulator
MSTRIRLSKEERRERILTAAIAQFAARGFGGATTAVIATESGSNEALIFRHYGSKSELYIACVDAAWRRLAARCDELCVQQPAALHWRMPGRAFLEINRDAPATTTLWMRGIVERTGDDRIDEHLAARLGDIHTYITEHVERSRTAGGLTDDRDPATEAWTIMAVGMLGASLAPRGLITAEAFDAVLSTHRMWMTGSPL